MREGRCVEDSGCDAGSCGVCERFARSADFPEAQDTCLLGGTLRTSDIVFESSEGEGNVWLCAGSSVYPIDTTHLALEAGPKHPAEPRAGPPERRGANERRVHRQAIRDH